jgi:DNA-binding GntR family transcriptional regulator
MSTNKNSRFNQPEAKLLHEEVISSIFHALIEGELKPGERLAEEAISVELGVSRGPVRRALQEMDQQGIVELIPRKGARVASWSVDDFEDFFRVRLVLEGLAAEQAVSRVDAEGLSILCDLSEKVRGTASKGEVEDAIDWDIKFHREFVKMSGNNTLINVYELMLLRIKMFLIAEKSMFPSDFGYEHALIRHDAICDAFEKRDAGLAKQLVEEHIQESAEGLLSRIRDFDKKEIGIIASHLIGST